MVDRFVGIYTAIHGLALRGARRFSDAIPFPRSAVVTLLGCAGRHKHTDQLLRPSQANRRGEFSVDGRNRGAPPSAFVYSAGKWAASRIAM